MTEREQDAGCDDARILEAVRATWGFDALRPLQMQAIRAGLAGRDALVVMPTGGGKSLCFQVPPLVTGGLSVVVSPLVALMSDQVEGLRQVGYPAAAVHSGLDGRKQDAVRRAVEEGEVRLLYLSPERLARSDVRAWLRGLEVAAFAIDEAHCISHWGHDFRPEYRRLADLRHEFPRVAIGAFTATATPRVRDDVVSLLGLEDPELLVGDFDRPNLTYRIVPRTDKVGQTFEVLQRCRGAAGIVYALSRKETEELAAALTKRGIRCAHYHAGMADRERRIVERDFAREKLDVVVATVAFGMGIDRSDVRAVVHATMPRSIEAYQQEAGRAGRDGLPAECVLLASGQDVLRWKSLIERSHAESEEEVDPELLEAQLAQVETMGAFMSTFECRHRRLCRYFGQYDGDAPCGACDVCLGEAEPMPESTTIARKILSAVARLDQRFGVGHVVAVLRGADVEAVRSRGHDRLSVFGLLAGLPEKSLQNLVYQLLGQDLLARSGGDRPVVVLTERGVAALRGEREVLLREPRVRAVARAAPDDASWEGVDRDLFDRLRGLRREIAEQRQVPAYVVFGDRSLREMAKRKPGDLAMMESLHGVGRKKLAEYGPRFLEVVVAWCRENGERPVVGLGAET